MRALSTGGPDAVRVESLARAQGVSKGGFYGYFANRRALLNEMLDDWERRSTEEVIARIEREGGDAMSKALRAEELTFSGQLLSIDLAVRDWSRRDPDVADRLRRVDNQRMDYLRAQIGAVCKHEAELELRCMVAFSLAIGDYFIAADHNALTREDVLQLAVKWLFSPDGSHRLQPDRE